MVVACGKSERIVVSYQGCQAGDVKALQRPTSQVAAGEFGGAWTTIMSGTDVAM